MKNTNKTPTQINLNNELGYFQVVFVEKDKQLISKIANKIFAKNDFYTSEEYTSGDVTNDLHMTLFYGIKNEKLDIKNVTKYLSTLKLSRIKLGEIKFFNGYKNQYKVAHIEVIDLTNQLTKLASSFKMFPYDETVQFDKYRPHITLAYVKNSFDTDKFYQNRLPKISLPTELVVKRIEYIPD